MNEAEDTVINLEDVGMEFLLPNERVGGLKEYLLKLAKRQLQYKKFKALEGITFSVRKGEVLGVIGGNGAGKSTLLKLISGIMEPTQGSVRVIGKIAPMLELGAGFDVDLTARENIFLNGAVLGYSEKYLKEKYREIVEFAELQDFIDVPLRNFSSGMVMRLAFSIATQVEPDILIVDEILAVGDAGFQNKSYERMRAMMSGGATVIMVSHTIAQIRKLCHRVIWIKDHKIHMDGDPKTVCDCYEAEINAG